MNERWEIFRKEDVMLLAQLLHTIQDVLSKLETYYEKKDIPKFNSAKKELLTLQKRINEVL